ncbi:MAG: hypothetical protein V4733_09580 [Verrucomicrobiota bacterium]
MQQEVHRYLASQFKKWLLHGILNALPSFVIALQIIERNKQTAVLAMLAAFALFIAAFTICGTLIEVTRNKENLIGRAIALGARFRTATALCSLIPACFENLFLVCPDFWLGYFASIITQLSFDKLQLPGGSLSDGEFSAVFFTTIIEGLMISGILVFTALIFLSFLQDDAAHRQQREWLETKKAR